jgi:cytochrome c oxidase subunit II
VNELFRRLLCLPPQASSVAPGIDALHYAVIGCAALGAIVLTIATGAFMIIYRERAGARPRPPVSRTITFELGAAAATLALFLAFWVIGFRQYVALREPPPGALRVYVVAKQWMWQFAYPGGAVAEDELRVPVDQPVELVMTSRDVIHSFYVPAFRLKQDVVPGRMTSLWFTATAPGRYDIACAEYCGNGHSRMRGAVVVLPAEDYARWSAGGGTRDLADAGAKVAATRGCLRCHTVDGVRHIGPTWAGLYGSVVALADGSTARADDAYLTESMMDPAAKVVAGFAPVMPSYLGQLSGPEAAALVEYIRSLADARPAPGVSP